MQVIKKICGSIETASHFREVKKVVGKAEEIQSKDGFGEVRKIRTSRNMKNRNKDELLEGVHWVTQVVSGSPTTMWTKI